MQKLTLTAVRMTQRELAMGWGLCGSGTCSTGGASALICRIHSEACPVAWWRPYSGICDVVSRNQYHFGMFHSEHWVFLNSSMHPSHKIHDLVFWMKHRRNGLLWQDSTQCWGSWALIQSHFLIGEIRGWEWLSWQWAMQPWRRVIQVKSYF